EELFGGGDGEGGDFADVSAADANRPGVGAKALTTALGTNGVTSVFREHYADVQLVFLALHFSEKAVDSDESGAAGALVAVEQDLLLHWRQILPGYVHRNGQRLG